MAPEANVQSSIYGLAGDDAVLPFAVAPLDVRGRIVHLGTGLESILTRHRYPTAVSCLVGEALVLAALLGASLKIDGQLLIQTQTDGPVSMLVADFRSPGDLRAYAAFDEQRLAGLSDEDLTPARLLGTGNLALTIDPGGAMNRYQGIVALDGETLEAATHRYFAQSEQIPTRIRLSVAQSVTRTPDGQAKHGWKAGGILVQYLPRSADDPPHRDIDPGDTPDGLAAPPPFDEDDSWREAQALVDTVEDHELTDPAIGVERLLYRLFHERGVRVFESRKVQDKCRCSRQRIDSMLANFAPDERNDITINDEIVVTCEFCNTRYLFDPKAYE